MSGAKIQVAESENGLHVTLSGNWTLAALPMPLNTLDARLRTLAVSGAIWDLQAIARIDSVGAILLWRAWGQCWPTSIKALPQQRSTLERVACIQRDRRSSFRVQHFVWLLALGQLVLDAGKNLQGITTLIGEMLFDVAYLFFHPRDIPWREFSANLYKSGAQALPVTALVGFLIGVVLSYLSSLQLRTFGADIYIVNLLGIGIIRELGPVIVAVLIAGRSGSAMTAQIGVMRVTEEIDALATMGVSRSLRLVFPKVAALSVAMPLLVVWCASAGILGGMVAANLEMGLDYGFFIDTLPRVVPLANLWIGISKGFLFGMLIALVACHFGLKVKPNTESLSSKTTTSVVTAITVVIIVDALFAVLTRGVGMPGSGG